MATCRCSHDAYLTGIYAPFGCILTQQANSLFSVRKRHIGVSIGHTVFQDSIRNTLVVKPPGHVVAFVRQGDLGVCPSRTHDDGHPVRIRCRIDTKGRLGDPYYGLPLQVFLRIR